MDKETNCPCCYKHCSVEELRCNRGMNYFKSNDIVNEHKLIKDNENKQPLIMDSKGEKELMMDNEGENESMMDNENKISQEVTDNNFERKLYKQIRTCGRLLHHQGGRKAGQHRILTNLYENGKMTQRELQDIIDIKSGSLSEILNKVESHGYIQRSKNEQDKRLMDLELTNSGKEAAILMNKQQEEFTQQIFVRLNEDEKEQLSMLLGKLLDDWKTSMNELEDSVHREGHRGGHRRGGHQGVHREGIHHEGMHNKKQRNGMNQGGKRGRHHGEMHHGIN